MKKTKDKGITLIALVITIIILLILAGISIGALGGENGLFSRTKQAKQNTLDAQNEENKALSSYEERINDELGEKAQYTIEYILEDESQSISSQIKIKYEDITLSAVKPTKSGYNFKGWTTIEGSEEVEYKAGDIYSENKSIKLYPIWKEKDEAQIFVEKAGIEYTFESLDDFVTNSTDEQKRILGSNSNAIIYLREHTSLIDELKATTNYSLIVPYLLSTDTTSNSANYNVGLPSYIMNGNKLYLGGNWSFGNAYGSWSNSNSEYIYMTLYMTEGWCCHLITTDTIDMSQYTYMQIKSSTSLGNAWAGQGYMKNGLDAWYYSAVSFGTAAEEKKITLNRSYLKSQFAWQGAVGANQTNNMYLYYSYLY